MSDWEPATEAEATMRDALAASDQEHYFRILARTDVLLPVSPEALAGRAPMGWGTWTTGNRTHVLAFTSGSALVACLGESGGSYRKLAFHELATEWPNYEWWLAVNPGLPIESYLPSWFVSQLTRGDVRLPGRTMGARARMAQSELAAALNGRIRATAPAPASRVSASVPSPGGSGAPPLVTAPVGDWHNGHSPLMETIEAEIIDSPTSEPTVAVPAAAPPAAGPSPAGYGSPLGYATEPGYGAQPEYGVQPGYGAQPEYGVQPGYGAQPEYEPQAGYPADTTYGAQLGSVSASARVPMANNYAADASRTLEGDPRLAAEVPPRTTATRPPEDAEVVSGPAGRSTTAGAEAWANGFAPANETESNLLAAAEESNTDAFLSTLLLARVILPVPPGTPSSARPSDHNFPWQFDEMDGQRFVSCYTSPERLAEHGYSRFGGDISSVSLRFVQLIGAWPGENVSFAINPGSPVGATLPGSQIVALASWAAEVGLRAESSAEVVIAPKKAEATPVMGVAGAPVAGAEHATVMQRTVPPSQLPYYLERGYDRVSGFVHRASDVAHLTTPHALYRALGLSHSGSPFTDDDEAHVLRWVAHRAELYRIPYGGQHEAGMRAMQGWVIERAPFRGNGFAPGDTDVISEFKVDSVRLPHGAQMWRLDRSGLGSLLATFDADAARWVRTDQGRGDAGGITGA